VEPVIDSVGLGSAHCLMSIQLGLSTSPLDQTLDAADNSAGPYLQLGPAPQRPPDVTQRNVTHVMDSPMPSRFFFCCSSIFVYYSQCKVKNEKQGRPGNEAIKSLTFLEEDVEDEESDLVVDPARDGKFKAVMS